MELVVVWSVTVTRWCVRILAGVLTYVFAVHIKIHSKTITRLSPPQPRKGEDFQELESGFVKTGQ